MREDAAMSDNSNVKLSLAISAVGAFALCFAGAAQAAQNTQTASRVIGEVTAVDASSRQVSVRSDKGGAITLLLPGKVGIRKVRPGTADLTSAATIDFSQIGVGDRILASIQPAGATATFEARSVVIMSRSDVDEKQKQEREDWHKRGVAGTVTSLDSGAGTFTIKAGQTPVIVQTSPNADVRRYAPNSVRFIDARKSSLSEIQRGDLVRVLGDRSPDGTSIGAERVVFGTFVQLAATISAINADSSEIVVRDLASKKNITLTVSADTVVRRLPPDAADALARRYRPSGENRPGATIPDTGQLLERLPSLPLTDLHVGDAVMLSMTAATGAERPLAVVLLTGVEPLLTASPTATRDIPGGWNLSTAGENP